MGVREGTFIESSCCLVSRSGISKVHMGLERQGNKVKCDNGHTTVSVRIYYNDLTFMLKTFGKLSMKVFLLTYIKIKRKNLFNFDS
jgi:hypothetical protein